MASGVYWSGEDKSVSSSAGRAWLGGEAAISIVGGDAAIFGAASTDQPARGTDEMKMCARDAQLCRQAGTRSSFGESPFGIS